MLTRPLYWWMPSSVRRSSCCLSCFTLYATRPFCATASPERRRSRHETEVHGVSRSEKVEISSASAQEEALFSLSRMPRSAVRPGSRRPDQGRVPQMRGDLSEKDIKLHKTIFNWPPCLKIRIAKYNYFAGSLSKSPFGLFDKLIFFANFCRSPACKDMKRKGQGEFS